MISNTAHYQISIKQNIEILLMNEVFNDIESKLYN